MPLKELLSQRPNVLDTKTLDFSPQIDVDAQTDILFEALKGHQYFNTAFYTFEQQRLVRIELLTSLKNPASEARTQSFVADMIAQNRQPLTIEVVDLRVEKAPALFWQKGNVHIACAFPFPMQKNSHGILLLRIQEGQLPDLHDEFRIVAVPAKEKEKMLAPVRLEVERLLQEKQQVR
jgi:hypothetical protein